MRELSKMTMPEERPLASSEAARRAMIDSQLRPSGVNQHWVLAAMASVPREDFVPEAMRDAAYIDRAIPLGEGRWLAAPLVHGRMLEEAAPRPGERVLLVGDGNGYLAALLRPMVGTLDSITVSEALVAGDGGYDLVIVDGAIEILPDSLADRVAANGRIVTGIVSRGITRLATGRKAAGTVSLLPLAEIGMPALPELAEPKRWSF